MGRWLRLKAPAELLRGAVIVDVAEHDDVEVLCGESKMLVLTLKLADGRTAKFAIVSQDAECYHSTLHYLARHVLDPVYPDAKVWEILTRVGEAKAYITVFDDWCSDEHGVEVNIGTIRTFKDLDEAKEFLEGLGCVEEDVKFFSTSCVNAEIHVYHCPQG